MELATFSLQSASNIFTAHLLRSLCRTQLRFAKRLQEWRRSFSILTQEQPNLTHRRG